MRKTALLAIVLVTVSANADQLRVIELRDHPDPNTGTPRVLDARAWPATVDPLLDAVSQAVERRVSIYDMAHARLAQSATAQTEETNVRVLDTGDSGARVSVTMDSSPTVVEAFVPRGGTAVIGSDSIDEHHAYVAVSIIQDDDADVVVPHEPGVVAPVRISGTNPEPNAVVEIEIDEAGNVAAVHVLAPKHLLPAEELAIDTAARTWRFRPATRDGKPVRVVTTVLTGRPRR